MGCASSTEIATDPKTGQQREKHKLGGAYPGMRRPQSNPYTPGASEFNSQGQATAHFVSYGGGNALVLQQNGIAQPQAIPQGKTPTYIQVTLPDGVNGGDKIHVRAPDGRLNEIIVPAGFGPGSTFTVEFADDPPANKPAPAPYSYAPPPVAPATSAPSYNPSYNSSNNDHDDGFASGFNNPNFVPTAAPATSYGNDDEIDLSAYPAATDAKPVYSSAAPYVSSAAPYVSKPY